VEHIVETAEWMDQLVTLLRGFDVFFVGVHCPLDELERREAARGDRPVGGARRDFETIHRHATYDLQLDALQAPTANALTLISAWRRRPQPSAFTRMAAEET
jgi:chloramphenicol 3-O phosphotransferase